MMDQHKQAFREEAYELLGELENSLLELEERPEEMEIIGRVFRAMHTIKGSGAMFGFCDIAEFTHEVETVFDMVRNGRIAVSKELIRHTLAARDQIKAMLDGEGEGAGADRSSGERIIAELRRFLPAGNGSSSGTGGCEGQTVVRKVNDDSGKLITYRIRFKPGRDIFFNGSSPLGLINELRQLGNCKVIAQRSDLPSLEELDPERCYIFWDIILTTAAGTNAIKDVFIFVEDDIELTIEIIDDGSWLDNESGYKKLGEILVERGDLDALEMKRVLSEQKRLGEILISQGLTTPDRIHSALVEQQHVKEIRQHREKQEAVASIRVPAVKLDGLVNLVGELVTVQARLSQMAALRNEVELTSVAEEVERLIAELRDNALGIRMLPIGSTFSKFRRLVHDLSRELAKEVEMITDGEETELDKNIIEKLNDPLVHLIRNSIDHGIEPPEGRKGAGKAIRGTIRLAAVHSGDCVAITISDDGAGLDRDAIREKAVEKGLISAAAELSDREIFSQIFAPGFSTAKTVSSVSGRGVGMDVVKQAICALRGNIEIESIRGKGTVITIRIPLTMAIIESLLVKIGEDCFVMPLSDVDECVALTRSDRECNHGRNIANVRGEVVPYIPLRERFGISGAPPDIEQIVITRINDSRVGIVVDSVIGEHQTVIKSLGKAYQNVQGLSGATILGNGTVALILDIPQLLKAEKAQQDYILRA